MSYREIATSFLKSVIAGEIREAYDKYVSGELVHHNPYFKGDRESLLLAQEEDYSMYPDKTIDIKLTLEDDDLVTTYSHVQRKSDEKEIAAMHIFRFENSKIVEMWDVAVFIPEDSPNENGMF